MERAELARLVGAKGAVGVPSSGPAIVDEIEPERFMAAFARAAAGNGPVFLVDPAWGAAERTAMQDLLAGASAFAPAGLRRDETGWIMIPSGGTSGGLKFARHDQETLSAAVRGFCGHFGVERVHAIGVLPLHHVSGFVAWMRAALSGGTCLPWPWKRLEAGEYPAPPAAGRGEGAFVSLVPTQLQRLLGSPAAVAWLRKFDAVFVGGGPVWPELADAAARAEVPVSLSYGMTETAAMVAALRPGEFLSGDRSCGSALPHAKIDLSEEGLVRVRGPSNFHGYFPGLATNPAFTSEDLGRLDERGHLHVLGRQDAVIITGGRKVDPAEVEAVLRVTGEFADVAVVGLPDPEWGQVIVACRSSEGKAPDLSRVSDALKRLAVYKRPRRYVAIVPWPRNASGKVNRRELARLALAMLKV